MLTALRAYRSLPAALAVVLVLGVSLPLAWAVCARAMAPVAPAAHEMAAHAAPSADAAHLAPRCHDVPPPPCHPMPDDAGERDGCCHLGVASGPADAMMVEATSAPLAGLTAGPAVVRSLATPPTLSVGRLPAAHAPPGVARHLLLSVFLI